MAAWAPSSQPKPSRRGIVDSQSDKYTCLATCILSLSRDTNVATRQVGTRLALNKGIVSVSSRPKAPNASPNMPHSDKQ